MDDQKILGIDIGGTKVQIGVVQNGKILEEIKLSTSAQAPEEQILKDIIGGIEQVIGADVAGIGVGVPGLVDEENGIVYGPQNIPSWREVHLKKHLEGYFNLPVHITNDANSFATGEKIYGKGKSFKNLVGITLGTGFGTGIIIGGSLYSGTLSSAGEFGGIPYLDKTIEDYCSGKFFLNESGKDGKALQALAINGDAHALEIFSQFGQHLGNAIKIMLYALSPEAIFLGGSVSSCYPFFRESMEKSIQDFPFKMVTEKLVVERSEVENVAVLGAAALFLMKNTNSLQPQKA